MDNLHTNLLAANEAVSNRTNETFQTAEREENIQSGTTIHDYDTPLLAHDALNGSSFQDDDGLFRTMLLDDDGIRDQKLQTNSSLVQQSSATNPITTSSDHYVDLYDVFSASNNMFQDTTGDFMNRDDSGENIQQQTPGLSWLNYLNVISFVWNLSIAIIVGYFGLPGSVQSFKEVTEEYQSLLTPVIWTNFIWIPIFTFDGFYALVQLFPSYRARALIQETIGLHFFYSNILQSIVTVLYEKEYMFTCFVFLLYMLVFHIVILITQMCHDLRQQRALLNTSLDYYSCRFPFSLKFGFIVFLTAVCFMEALVAHDEGVSVHLTSSIIILVLLVTTSLFFLVGFGDDKPDYVVSLVIVWSLMGVYVELQNPRESIDDFFSSEIIISVRSSSFGCCVIILCLLIPRIVVTWIRTVFTVNISTFEH